MDVERVFDILKTEKKISKDEIVKFLSMDDINYLLDEEILKLEENNEYYVIDSIENAFHFGRDFYNENNKKTANSIFDCCYKTDPNNFLVNYQLFYRSLFSKKTNIIYKYFRVVYPTLKNSGREKDANFYLLMLGYIHEMPNKYKEDFKNIKLEDILLDEDDLYYSETRNNMRKCIYDRQYYNASRLMDIVFDCDNEDLGFEERLEKELIQEVVVNFRHVSATVEKYLVNDELEELNKYYEKQHQRRNLQLTSEYAYLVLKRYLEIEKTGIVPEIKTDKVENTFQAIEANDFHKAYKLIVKYNEDKKVIHTNALFDILGKTVLLIDRINGKENTEIIEKKQLSKRDQNMIDDKVREIRNGKILSLLEPMDKERRNLIHGYVSKYDDIVSFSIGEGNERRVLIRYKSNISEKLNLKDISEEIKHLVYEDKDYEEAFKLYRIILTIGRPLVKDYARCGKTLLHLGRKNEAIEMFKAATLLAKENNMKDNDYSDFIDMLLNENRENFKEKVDMDLSEFEDNKEVNFDKDIINDLIGLINENEITLLEACTKLNLSEAQINYVKLIKARDCFYSNDFKAGEQLLKEVTKSKEKTKEVKDLMREINESKKYYHNRLDSEKSQIVFKKK